MFFTWTEADATNATSGRKQEAEDRRQELGEKN
jgi:hypothetical protein